LSEGDWRQGWQSLAPTPKERAAACCSDDESPVSCAAVASNRCRSGLYQGERIAVATATATAAATAASATAVAARGASTVTAAGDTAASTTAFASLLSDASAIAAAAAAAAAAASSRMRSLPRRTAGVRAGAVWPPRALRRMRRGGDCGLEGMPDLPRREYDIPAGLRLIGSIVIRFYTLVDSDHCQAEVAPVHRSISARSKTRTSASMR
jgi:hypothetical protein